MSQQLHQNQSLLSYLNRHSSGVVCLLHGTLLSSSFGLLYEIGLLTARFRHCGSFSGAVLVHAFELALVQKTSIAYGK